MNRINLVCLGVRCIKTSLQFYKNIGFKTYEKAENLPIVFFDNQGTKLSLYSEGSIALSQGGFGGITLACNMKSPEEVDAIFKAAQQHGGKIVKPAQDVFWGGYSGYFQDPDRYYWEVAYAECWKFDVNDMLVIEPAE